MSKPSPIFSPETVEPKSLRDARDLVRLPIAPAEQERNQAAANAYNVRVPEHYLRLIDWQDPQDPVRLQSLPLAAELQWDPRERRDPIGDKTHSPVPRLTHRYPDRVLLYPTYQCAIYCRHCFRKESLSDASDQFSAEALAPALNYIREHTEVQEVILTGGDPLMLSNSRLQYLREQLEAIPHLRMLRLHSRIPVVLPTRITPDLVTALQGRLMVTMVTHFNHPRELAPACVEAARLLRESGFVLLNQTVLLRGINDKVETLATLFRELMYFLGIKPYYLHHCDHTQGLTHFRTTIDKGLELMAQLRGNVSGICLPTYVLDLPGGDGKILLGPSFVQSRAGYDWVFRNYQGKTCAYSEIVAENPPPKPPI